MLPSNEGVCMWSVLWHWKWLISAGSLLLGIIFRWKDVMYFYDWCLTKYDAPVLSVIRNEGAICTVDFVARACSKRSRRKIESSLTRLEGQGKIYRLLAGFVTKEHYDAIGLKRPWRWR